MSEKGLRVLVLTLLLFLFLVYVYIVCCLTVLLVLGTKMTKLFWNDAV